MIGFFERLDKYMEINGLNDNKVTIETGISNGLIGKARKRGSLSLENVSKILLTYRDIDANWLILGQGEMLISDKKDQKGAGSPDGEAVGKITSLEKEVELLRKQLSQTREHLKTLKEFNEMLKEQLSHDGEKYNRKAN